MAPRRIFLAGIIQGSKRGPGIHGQGYRLRLRLLLSRAFPRAEIYCPVENHPRSVGYTKARARAVFEKHVGMVRRSDVVVVYLPSASMGSAVEMWEARRRGAGKGRPAIWAITPLSTNWVVRLTADRVFKDLKALAAWLRRGSAG